MDPIICKACDFESSSDVAFCPECGSNLQIQIQKSQFEQLTTKALDAKTSHLKIENKYLKEYHQLLQQIDQLSDVDDELIKQKNHYNTLISEQNILSNQLQKLELKVSEEYKDVEKLEKLSWTSFIAKMKGDKEVRFEKEHQEYLEVLNKKEAVEETLHETSDRVQLAKNELNSIQELSTLKQKLEQKLYDVVHEACQNVVDPKEDKLEEDTQSLRSQLVPIVQERSRIQNTLSYLEDAKRWFEKAIDELDEAEHYSTIDTFFGGGSFWVDSIKHSRFGDARNYIRQAQHSLQQAYRTYPSLPKTRFIQVDEGGEFFDVFFDNFFSDIAMRRKIQQTLRSVIDAKNDVEASIQFLQSNLEHVNRESAEIKTQLKNKQVQLTVRRRELMEEALEIDQ